MPHSTATDLAADLAVTVPITRPIIVSTDRASNRHGTASLQTRAP